MLTKLWTCIAILVHMEYQYAYLLGTSFIFFPVWLFLFWHRKDLRTNIVSMSIIFGICGPIFEFWYLQDYWSPQTITGTKIGIEDFLFGFFFGGIASVVYKEFSSKHISKFKSKNLHWKLLVTCVTSSLFVFCSSFYLFGINSIYASIIVFLLMAAVTFILRKDLFVEGLMSGLFLATGMFFAYLIFLSVFPEAIHRWWFLHNISGILIAGIPLEELAWAFCLGLVAGPSYELYTGVRILKK